MIKKKRKKAAPQIAQDPIKQYMDFHGKDSAKLITEKIEMPEPDNPLVFIGKAPEVIYLSNKKDNVIRLYKHGAKKFGNIYAVVSKKDKRVKTLIISNLNMRIDKRGLIG